MDDIKDLQNQLLAIQNWLDELRTRLVRDHHTLGAKEVNVAIGKLTIVHGQLSTRLQQLEN